MMLRRLHVGLPALLALIVLGVYWHGLGGGFLFDDYANLPALGAFGPVDNVTTLLRYVTSGTADPTGRPLSLLTFLLDARDWPANPRAFLRTNVIIHATNAVLLFALLVRLGHTLRIPADRRRLAALFGAAAWALHPLFVSTTLYVIQRQAMLPALWCLLGMIGWWTGWQRDQRGDASGPWVAGVSLATCTLLGVLSKTNGALLPLLAGLLHAVVLHPNRTRDPSFGMTVAHRMAIMLPSFVVLLALAKLGWNGFQQGLIPDRGWTLEQRLWTECRVLWRYLYLLWIPRIASNGLFNDDIQPSDGLLSPLTTLFAAAGWLALMSSGWALRRRQPAAATAILFFGAAHLLESSVIPLELYFEHRNYLPAMLLFWPVGLTLLNPDFGTRGFLLARRALAAAIPLALAAMTVVRVDLWRQPNDQAHMWALRNPSSPRAQTYLAAMDMADGRIESATVRMRHALSRFPDQSQVALTLIDGECVLGTITPTTLIAAQTALASDRRVGPETHRWFVEHIEHPQACRSLRSIDMDALLSALERNPLVEIRPGRQQDVLNLRGRLALQQRNGAAALEWFEAAVDVDPTPQTALQQAALLGRNGFQCLGIRHLERQIPTLTEREPPLSWSMAALHARLLWHQRYWVDELERLHRLLMEDAPDGHCVDD